MFLWCVIAGYGQTYRTIYVVSKSEHEDPVCVLLLDCMTCRLCENHVDICVFDVLTWVI